MELIAVAIAVGVCLAVIGQGQLGRLLDTRVRLILLPILALVAQLVLGLWSPSGGWTDAAGLTVYLGSFTALIAFCLANLRLTGMSVVLLGVACNALVVVINGAMPIRLPTDASEARRRDLEHSVIREPEDDADALAGLGQIILIPGPAERAVSFGDLILSVGLVDVLFRAARPPRRRPLRARPVPDDRALGDDAGEGGEDPAVAQTAS